MKRRRCKELSILLVDYVDGRLDNKVSLRIERHIEECPECGELYEKYVECIKMLREVEIEVPEDLEDKLLSLIEEISRR